MSVWVPELQSDGCRSLPVWLVSRCPILPEWRTGTGLDMSWHSSDRRRSLIVRTHSGSGPRPFSSRHQSLQVQVKTLNCVHCLHRIRLSEVTITAILNQNWTFLMPWFHQFSLNTNFGVAELIHEIKCYFSKWTLCWHFLGHIASKCLIIQLH